MVAMVILKETMVGQYMLMLVMTFAGSRGLGEYESSSAGVFNHLNHFNDSKRLFNLCG